MTKISIAAALALALAAGSASAEFKDFTVNGELVSKARQEAFAAEAVPASAHGALTPELEEQVKGMIIEYKVMSRLAREQGLEKKPEVREEIAAATDMILMKHAVNEYLKANPVTDKEMKAEYDKEAALWGDKEYRVRHIMVKDKVEAEKLLEQIGKGASFAKLASEHSLDTQSKPAGGILDWTSPSVYTGELGDAVKSLKKGEVAKAPVQSPAGWHVVKVEDIRKAELFPAYEARKEDLRQFLTQRKVRDFIVEKVKAADVKDAPAKK